jgi:hypothetical protein
VTIEKKVYDREDPEEKEGTIASLIDKGEIESFSSGKLTAASKNIGGAVKTGIKIELDESSRIGKVSLIEDNGSESELKKDEYTIKTYPDEIPSEGSYYAEITFGGYYLTDDFRVITVTGKGDTSEETSSVEISDGGEITVGVIIDIPEIESVISQMISIIANMMKVFTLFLNVI